MIRNAIKAAVRSALSASTASSATVSYDVIGILNGAQGLSATSGRRVAINPFGNYVFSGDIGAVVPQHSYERVRHFFTFMAYMQVFVDYINKKGSGRSKPITLAEAIKFSASFQVGKGYYDKSSYPGQSLFRFDSGANDILHRPSTGKIDAVAAHYNNISPNLDFLKIAQYELEQNPDSFFLNKGLEVIFAMCAGTNIIPRELNSGPEKVIDFITVNYARKMLATKKAGAFPSGDDVSEYVDLCKTGILKWEAEAKLKKTTQMWKVAAPYNQGFDLARINFFPDMSRGAEYFFQDVLDSGDKTLGDVPLRILNNYFPKR